MVQILSKMFFFSSALTFFVEGEEGKMFKLIITKIKINV